MHVLVSRLDCAPYNTDALSGAPCDPFGHDMAPQSDPLPLNHLAQDDWTPYESCAQFELAEFLYQKVQMSTGKIDSLMQILAMLYGDRDPPWSSHDALYESINAIPYGDHPWQSFAMRYSGVLSDDPPLWMLADYDVWYRSPLTILE